MLLQKALNVLGFRRSRGVSPALREVPSSPFDDAVRAVIDEFRPYIVADGGDIELVGVDVDGIVRVRMKGACVGCPASFMTLQMGLERQLKERVPGIRAVESV